MTCSVENCERKARSSGGLCGGHYMRLHRWGELRPEVPLRAFRDPWRRLTLKVSVQPNGCWRWIAATDWQNYGYINVDNVPMPAYRFAYLLDVGPIPDGFHLDHVCHTRDLTCSGGITCEHRRCVNPDHLEPVSPAENQARVDATKHLRPKNGRVAA